MGYLASHRDHRRHSAIRATQQRVTGSKDRVGKSHCTKLSQDPDILLFRNILRFQIYILLRCLSLLSVAGTHYLTYPIMPFPAFATLAVDGDHAAHDKYTHAEDILGKREAS